MPRFKKIIPNVTPCCLPTVPHCHTTEGDNLIIDGDCANPGDYLVCRIHTDETIYVFGTNWWALLGGTMADNPIWDLHCYECNKKFKIEAWSYRG